MEASFESEAARRWLLQCARAGQTSRARAAGTPLRVTTLILGRNGSTWEGSMACPGMRCSQILPGR